MLSFRLCRPISHIKRVHASFTSLPLGEHTEFLSSKIFWPWCCWHFGLDNSLLRNCPVLFRMFSSIPKLYSLDATLLWKPKMTPDFANIIPSWKTTVFFSVNKPGFSLSSWVGHFQDQYATEAELQAATACFQSRVPKACCCSSFTASHLFLYSWGPKEMFPLFWSSALSFWFSSLSFLSLIAMCLKQRENIKCELMEPTWLEVSRSKSNLLFCLKLSLCLQ